jgi:hypothetical protein
MDVTNRRLIEQVGVAATFHTYSNGTAATLTVVFVISLSTSRQKLRYNFGYFTIASFQIRPNTFSTNLITICRFRVWIADSVVK